jgi:streptomycin 6-kinase
MATRFGPEADGWWAALPALTDELADDWSLTLDGLVARGATSVVFRCAASDGRGGYLKITPEPQIAQAEGAALDRWATTGRVPEVWHRSHDRGALLLEALPSERPLDTTGTPVGVAEVAGLIAQLHGVPPDARSGQDEFPQLEQRIGFLYALALRSPVDVGGAISSERLQAGKELALELASSTPISVLLHGDFHPGNVIAGPDARLFAIDPRACHGDPAFDVADWIAWQLPPDAWQQRADQFADALGLDRQRTWDWFRALAPLVARSELRHQSRVTERAEALLAVAP